MVSAWSEPLLLGADDITKGRMNESIVVGYEVGPSDGGNDGGVDCGSRILCR